MKHFIQPLPGSALKAASVTLARAFMHDPIQIYTLPDVREREDKSPAHFEVILRYGLKYGEVYTSERAEGVVIWLRSVETVKSHEHAGGSSLEKLIQILGKEASDRFFSVFDFLEPYHKEDVPEPHVYVFVVGVNPAFQGQGLGKALMETVIDKSQSSNTPVYLETASPATIAFYTKLGFSMVRELTDPGSKIKLWTFRRDC